MAPTTMRAGYSESSNTRLRHYGNAAAWTGTPPASSPSASPEPRGRQVLTTLRASLGDRRAAEDAVREAFRLAALRWDMIAGCPPETKAGCSLCMYPCAAMADCRAVNVGQPQQGSGQAGQS